MSERKKIVTYSRGRIMQYRRKIRYELLDGHSLYVTLDEGNFNTLVKGAMKLLKIPLKHEMALRETLLEFVGQEVNDRVGDRIALKLAGGLSLIKKGKPIRKFHGVTQPMWAPVEISEVRFGRIDRRKGTLFAKMLATVMAGPAVGTEITKLLPMKFIVSVLARELAWTFKDPRPAHNELVRMWFNAELAQHERYGLDIANFKCAPHHVRFNKKLKTERRDPCLRHYKLQCHKCPLGYVDCMRGTHRYTWLFKSCPECGREKAPYDPEQPSVRGCLSCQSKKTRAFWALARRVR